MASTDNPSSPTMPTLPRPPTPVTLYDKARSKMSEAAYKFNKDKDGLWLQSFEGSIIPRKMFLNSLKIGINCRLSDEELGELLRHFESDGAIDGTKFSLWFYRLRFEYKSKLQSDLLVYNRQVKEARIAEQLAIQKEADSKIYTAKVDKSFGPEHQKSAFAKVREAAFKYDRLMPGTVQLDGFDGSAMSPAIFKDQLHRCFNIQLNPKELAALVEYFDKDHSGDVNCQEFLIAFFRMGFDEKSKRLTESRNLEKRLKEEREKKAAEEKAQLDRKNNLKVSYTFSKADKDSALKKLREAAKLTDTTGGAMRAFETAFMQPHVFKEQLKRVFNIKITAPELGALMKVFDIDGDGTISCAEFSKIFSSMGHAEREREIKEYREKQRLDTERRNAAKKARDDAIAAKNASKVSYDFDDASFQSALTKLTESAWAFDKNAAGAPNLSAFESKEMEPHVFAEQLKRAFGMKLTPPELGAIDKYFSQNFSRFLHYFGIVLSILLPYLHFLLGALMAIFDPEQSGSVTCQSFLNKFLKVGMGERARRRNEWREKEIEIEKERVLKEAEKKREDDEKLCIQVDRNYSPEEFETAMTKLTAAACKYEKGSPGAITFYLPTNHWLFTPN